MIKRYTLPKMGSIWSEENKFRKWLEVEVAVAEGWAELGVVPKEAVKKIRERAGFTVERIEELERETRHDMVAFLRCVAEHIGDEDASRWLHYGVTSYDIEDTALSLLLRESADVLLEDLDKLEEALIEKAREHKHTVMIGRTHGVHAEPITFGLKLAVWVEEVRRCKERLRKAKETISVGKISGAVGSYFTVDPKVEEYVCKKFGLKPARASTQILQRDRHAEYVTTLALIGCSLEKFATEIRNLQRTEIREVEEPFAAGQAGSSAMPHKRNPIVCERICGQARVLRGYAIAAMEAISLWHERDLTNSSMERIILPDSNILLDYMLNKFADVIRGLKVYPERMHQNLWLTKGVVFSQKVMLALVEKGWEKQEAYRAVQSLAMRAFDEGKDFKELLLSDGRIKEALSAEEVERLLSPEEVIRRVEEVLRRVGI